MAKTEFSRVKLVVNDPYERLQSGEEFKSTTFTFDIDNKVAVVSIPKQRQSSSVATPEELTQVAMKGMHFVKYSRNGYGFKLGVNEELFLYMGVDEIVENFRQSVEQFLDYLKKR